MANRTNHKTPRVKNVDKKKRIYEIAEMLLNGLGYAEIIRTDIYKSWGIGQQQLLADISTAWKDIGSWKLENLMQSKTKAIAERDRLKVKALGVGDLRTALSAMDSRDKIEGILTDRKEVIFPEGIGLTQKDELEGLSREDLERLNDILGKTKPGKK